MPPDGFNVGHYNESVKRRSHVSTLQPREARAFSQALLQKQLHLRALMSEYAVMSKVAALK